MGSGGAKERREVMGCCVVGRGVTVETRKKTGCGLVRCDGRAKAQERDSEDTHAAKSRFKLSIEGQWAQGAANGGIQRQKILLIRAAGLRHNHILT